MIKTKVLGSSFLFKGVDSICVDKCLRAINTEEVIYKKNETVYSPADFDKKIGFIAKGEATVGRIKANGDIIPLNFLTSGSAFGVLAAFTGRDEFPTVITAKKDLTVVYVNRYDLEEMMKISHQLSINLIEFLASRIEFLCDKISSFSSDNVEQKLARYLYHLYSEFQSADLKFNKKHAAESLNTGRTSLYRSLEKLEQSGVIKINDKTIIITNLKELERIAK